MSQIYGIEFKINNERERWNLYQALQKILELSVMLYELTTRYYSVDERGYILNDLTEEYNEAGGYLVDPVEGEFLWMYIKKEDGIEEFQNSLNYVCIITADGHHYISPRQAENSIGSGKLGFDFYKAPPAYPSFLIAVLDILKHYLPDAELAEGYLYGQDAIDGLYLARLVIPEVEDAAYGAELQTLYFEMSGTDELKLSQEIQAICDTLRNEDASLENINPPRNKIFSRT